jgi:NAD(P)-dependent dehydrogenase (short-subunit alcohol dehydrogenase family)
MTKQQRTAIVTGAARGIGRVGQPDDVAHTASYLASPGAGFVSGQVIYVAGGPVDRVVLDCV